MITVHLLVLLLCIGGTVDATHEELPLTPCLVRRGEPLLDAKSAAACSTQVPQGIRSQLWQERIPAGNPLTSQKVELGRKLFFDKRLSNDHTLSCAGCHDPAAAFADGNPVALGIRGQQGIRNTPTVLNATFNESLFWDGRAASLEEQAKEPLINSREMGMKSHDQVVARVKSVREYADGFRQVFGKEGITIDTIVKAIASFERTLLSGNAPFDRFISGGSDAISPAQKRGWELFQGKARCIRCHVYREGAPFFTDFQFHNTGVASDQSADLSALQKPPSSPPLSKGGRSSLPKGHVPGNAPQALTQTVPSSGKESSRVTRGYRERKI